VRFMADLKSGAAEVRAPVYSHLTYDVVEDEYDCVRQPDIVIVEGLNVLPTRERAHLILEKGRDHAVRRVKLRKL